MDHNVSNGNNLRRDDNSLGILDIENLKGRGKFFGDLSSTSVTNSNNISSAKGREKYINDRLNNERLKAFETLQKSQKKDSIKRPNSTNNKDNSKPVNVSLNNPPMQLDHTDYVPFRRPNAINISDLVTDETINLENSLPYQSSVAKDNKVSFEPAEMTGRSTLYNKDFKNRIGTTRGGNSYSHKTIQLSVSDILASSFAPRARGLCQTLHRFDEILNADDQHSNSISSVPSTSACSSFTSYNASRSLPRTADMSLSKNSCTEESFNGGFETFSFSSAGAGTGVNEVEEFSPGELMQSKLINDEISWAQKYAVIPIATLSEQAKAKVLQDSPIISTGFDSPPTFNSISGDPNFSVGSFFNMRSDNIWNIVKSKSPDKCRTPVALVDEENNTVTMTRTDTGTSITPKIDNKTYTRIDAIPMPVDTKQSISRKMSNGNNHESKDSGNSTDNSYLLSISAIDRALCNLDIPSDSSGIGVSEQLLMQGKKSKSCINTFKEVESNSNTEMRSKSMSLNSDIKFRGTANLNVVAEIISENKENLDPESKAISNEVVLSDTMSFSESLLNTSDMKQLQRSIKQPRSPLSSIDVLDSNVLMNQVEDGEEADNDEWPSTPINSNRRLRRTKSPRDKRSLETNAAVQDSPNATIPLNSKSYNSIVSQNISKPIKETKSMSSTRLDGSDNTSSTGCEFGILPNISNSLVVRSNTLVVPQINCPGSSISSHLDSSPLSSPNNYVSQVSSPATTTIRLQSPHLNGAAKSDRQLLSVGDAGMVIVSSPVGSETSSTCSYGTTQTYRSAVSGSSSRSVSRCSSSSEFSHRDGKQIPIKVTNMELSWGSIKLRSDSRKSMQIKNIIAKRLVIRIEVSGPGFQIVNADRSNTITLHSHECRSISISFCPTVRGVAVGKLSFYAPSGALPIGQSFLDVALYGYGGNASIIAQNICVGPVGLPFVTMGDVCELAHPLERTVSFYNKGPLLGFAAISIDSIGLMMPRLSDAFEIHPRRILIPPKGMIDVRIVFRPKREEIKKIIKKMGSVLTLANIRVICGDEANRQRIRHLLNKMNDEERSKLSSSALDMLWSKFPQELEMQDLYDIKENPNVAMDLASFFRIHEILLTINHDNMDDTIESSTLFLADVDETVLFRTICATDSPTPSAALGTVEEDFKEVATDVNVDGCVEPSKQRFWSVSPKTVEFNLNNPERITLIVHNYFKSRKFYEVVCNMKELIRFISAEGYIAPNGKAEVFIDFHTNLQYPTGSLYIMVYIDNERVMVPVKIIK